MDSYATSAESDANSSAFPTDADNVSVVLAKELNSSLQLEEEVEEFNYFYFYEVGEFSIYSINLFYVQTCVEFDNSNSVSDNITL